MTIKTTVKSKQTDTFTGEYGKFGFITVFLNFNGEFICRAD